MNKEELARQYADNKVEERKEYPLLDMRKRKELTSFDGYAVEQAFEDGFDKAIDKACEWLCKELAGYVYAEYVAEELTGDACISDNMIEDFRKAMED